MQTPEEGSPHSPEATSKSVEHNEDDIQQLAVKDEDLIAVCEHSFYNLTETLKTLSSKHWPKGRDETDSTSSGSTVWSPKQKQIKNAISSKKELKKLPVNGSTKKNQKFDN